MDFLCIPRWFFIPPDFWTIHHLEAAVGGRTSPASNFSVAFFLNDPRNARNETTEIVKAMKTSQNQEKHVQKIGLKQNLFF